MPDGADSKGEVIGLVTFREAALLTVQQKIAPSMSHQRLSQLAQQDPGFPKTRPIGRARGVVWEELRPYLIERQKAAAARDSRRRMPVDSAPEGSGE